MGISIPLLAICVDIELVLAKYLFATNGHIPTNWELKGAALAAYTVAVLRMLAVRLIENMF